MGTEAGAGRTARYTISQGLTDGTSQRIEGLAYSRKATAIRIARLLACDKPAADVTDLYVDDERTGDCVFHKPARSAA